MTSTAVQIISIIAPVGAVVLGFALGVWWNNYQQKKRDERIIEVFKNKMNIELQHTIDNLLNIRNVLNTYKECIKRIDQGATGTVSWNRYPTVKKGFQVPESFALHYSNISKQIYKLENDLSELDYEVLTLCKRSNDIHEQYTKSKKDKKSTQNTLFNYKATERMVGTMMSYTEFLIEESLNILSFILKVNKEVLRDEIESKFNQNATYSPLEGYHN